jgi:23S rRNA pseudouridine955/2504/2580 synthase
MCITSNALTLTVTPEEQGVKLLRFLERRLQGHAPKSMLHKWIRTGQVRVNKGRAGPYHLLDAGDTVRLPPFALARQIQEAPDLELDLGPGLRVLEQTADYLVLAKSAGLPTQPGSPNTNRGADSVAGRLCAAFVDAPFIPAPAHRLDKQTSGIVLAGKNHTAQRRLHDLFRENAVSREYLAWVPGVWPHEQAVLLKDNLEQEHGSPVQALSVALPVQYLEGEAALLLVRLLTGRKHQIRVQLASRSFPVIGDARYGGPAFPLMLLHAYALGLPDEAEPSWSLLPEWPAPFMPDAARLFSARGLCDTIHIQRDILTPKESIT